MYIHSGWLSALTRAMTRAETAEQPVVAVSIPDVVVQEPTVPVDQPAPIEVDSVEATAAELLKDLQRLYAQDPWFQDQAVLSRNNVVLDHTGLYYRDTAQGSWSFMIILL